jgi:streptogramin lyase
MTPWVASADVSLNPGDVLVTNRSTVRRIDRFGVQTIVSNGRAYDRASAIAIDANGDILLGGQLPATQPGGPELGAAIIRIDPATQRQTIVSSGGSLSTPTGIVIDPNGDLLVADADSRAVIRVNPTTGSQTIVSSGSYLFSPSAIALATNGQLFVANEGPKAVIQIDPATGAQTVVTLAGLSLGRPTGIVIEASGDLLVANEAPSTLVRVDPATGTQTVIVTEGYMIIDGQLVESLLKWPVGLALEANGDILVLGRSKHDILRIDPVTLSQNRLASRFERPWDIALDANGEIFVADQGRRRDSSRVLHVDPVTGHRTVVSWGCLFDNVTDVVVDASGDILVTDTHRNAVVRVDPATGAPTIVSAGGNITDAWGIALEQNGDILVADGNSGGIVRIDPLTGHQTMVSPEGTFVRVEDLVVDGNGDILVADEEAGSVVRVDPTTGIGTVVSSGGDIPSPDGITIDPNGDIFVANCCSDPDAVVRIDPTTGAQTVVSSGGLLVCPSKIAADTNGDLLVADYSAEAVVLVEPVSGSQVIIAAGGGLDRPRGIAILPFGESPFQPFTVDTGPVSKEGQKCIRALNKSLAKVAKAQRRDNLACIKRGSRGELPGTIEECLVGDLRGKVAKAMARTVSAEAKSCTGNPFSFGASDSATVNDAAMRREIDLIHDIFGSDLDIAILPETTDKKGAICQQAVAKAVNKCEDTNLKAFNKCKKTALKDNSTDVARHLQNCMGQDPKHKIAKLCNPGASELQSALGWRCTGVDRSVAFPRWGTDDEGELARYLEESVNCRVCQALNQADVLNRNCDEFDDGLINGSCP